MTEGGVPGPGWYPDPWFTGQHRWWTGATWTGDVFPDGPVDAARTRVEPRPEGQRPPVPPPYERSATPPRAPTFGYAGSAAATSAATSTAVIEPWEMLSSGPEQPRRRFTSRQTNVLALLVGLVVGFVVVAAAVAGTGHKTAAAPVVPTPLPTVPSGPSGPSGPSPQSSAPVSSDPDAGVLQGLVVRQPDVPSTNSVQLLNGGAQVTGQTTLDLCNGTYPSEALRSARLQVVDYDPSGSVVLSTEAVLYRTAADAAQAMQELRSVAARCPDRPVVSPVGEQTVTTTFQAPPDGSWPHVGPVQRQAYAFTTVDAVGDSSQNVAVYLRRGRVLEGLYFNQPTGTQSAVDGQTTIAGIVSVFEHRIAALPVSVTKG